MDQVTRGWLVYELTDSALQLGLVRGIQAIPFLLLSPIAGSTADRYSRKFQVVGAQLANGLLFGVLALLIFSGLIQTWHVYVNAVLVACVQVFLQPSRAAMISDTVPPKTLTNAIGLNAVVFNMARSTGPALAGLLISLFNTGVAFVVQAIFFFLSTVWTIRMSSARYSSSSGAHTESFAQSIIEGWKFSWRNEIVRVGILVVVIAALFIIPFSTLLPVFARDILVVGAQGAGLAADLYGHRRVGQLSADRDLGRPHAARFADARRRCALRRVRDDLCRFAVVFVVLGAHGGHRAVPCELACACANRAASLLAARVSRPHHGDFSHDAGSTITRRLVDRRFVGSYRRAVGRGGNERSRSLVHGFALSRGAACQRNSLGSDSSS